MKYSIIGLAILQLVVFAWLGYLQFSLDAMRNAYDRNMPLEIQDRQELRFCHDNDIKPCNDTEINKWNDEHPDDQFNRTI